MVCVCVCAGFIGDRFHFAGRAATFEGSTAVVPARANPLFPHPRSGHGVVPAGAVLAAAHPDHRLPRQQRPADHGAPPPHGALQETGRANARRHKQ